MEFEEIPELETTSGGFELHGSSMDSSDDPEVERHRDLQQHNVAQSDETHLRDERGHPAALQNERRGRRTGAPPGGAVSSRWRLGALCGEFFFMSGTLALLALLFTLHLNFIGKTTCLPETSSRPEFFEVI
jgi:hypothetical protein